jgi:acetylornithine deacetylase/succinyl-diaminopimelate desuccinylase-like protein
MTELLIKHIEKIAPPYVTVKASEHHGGDPYLTPVDSIEYQAASKAIEATFGKTPIPVRGGGSIPITSYFKVCLVLKLFF